MAAEKYSDKVALLPSSPSSPSLPRPPRRPRVQKLRSWTMFLICGLIGMLLVIQGVARAAWLFSDPANPQHGSGAEEQVCPQVRPLVPSDGELLEELYRSFGDPVFRNKSAELLGAAVRIETESYDGIGEVGKDPRWDKFGPFHLWLEGAFPTAHSVLKKETVNTWGLVYTWQGSDPSLKPLLLTAHQDVVPVEAKTAGSWTHPPYSGFFDGQYIWGRGSADDKAGLVGSMIAVETLMKHSFKPTRTVVLAYGFDEEISGNQGALHIAKFLLARYGPEGFALIVDEGAGYYNIMGQVFAMPGVGEKGYIDAKLLVNTKGGHSSVPPTHTGIGILSSLITTIEANPIAPSLSRLNPFYSTLQCVGVHAPSLPSQIRKLIEKSRKSDSALTRVGEWVLTLPTSAISPIGFALMVTTQAVTLVQGGVKANALPEQSWAVINHRIVVDSSTAAVQEHLTALLSPEADKFNLSLTAFGETITPAEGRAGALVLSEAWGNKLEPAPVTPVDGKAWEVLGGTIRAVYARTDGLGGGVPEGEIVVSPGIMTGNTDTHHYWDLSTNIFRYMHLRPEGLKNGFHTVDEGIGIDNFLGLVQFFATLVLNVDEAFL